MSDQDILALFKNGQREKAFQKLYQLYPRIEKLILLVMIAFVWCYKIGIHLHQIKPITIKKHGRKAKSIFKYGLNFIAKFLLNANNQININVFQFLSCT